MPRSCPSAACAELGSGPCPGDSPLPLKYLSGWAATVRQLLKGASLSATITSGNAISECIARSRSCLYLPRVQAPRCCLAPPSTLDSQNQTTLAGHFEQWNHQPKAQKCKKCGTKERKGHLFTAWEMKQAGRGSRSSSPGVCTSSDSTFPLLCARLQMSTKHHQHWLGGYI